MELPLSGGGRSDLEGGAEAGGYVRFFLFPFPLDLFAGGEEGAETRTDAMGKSGRHTIEIPFVFDTASLFPPGGKEERVAKEVGERWAAFAIDGVPGKAFPSPASLFS